MKPVPRELVIDYHLDINHVRVQTDLCINTVFGTQISFVTNMFLPKCEFMYVKYVNLVHVSMA